MLLSVNQGDRWLRQPIPIDRNGSPGLLPWATTGSGFTSTAKRDRARSAAGTAAQLPRVDPRDSFEALMTVVPG
jgi:hypothetical protein